MAKKLKHREFTTYSNLAKQRGKNKRAIKREAERRKKAEYLATLPKNPVKRFFAHFHPKRVANYWFSKQGAKMFAKIVGITLLVLVLFVGGLFLYFRKELDALNPEELAKRVSTTVNKYYDRNGKLIWEDKGTNTYRLVVDSDQISKYVKDATVAIEDRDFYKHGGVSLSGMARAFFNNVRGGSTQGGSTLTQQLIKQVFFSDEAGERGIRGVPRKIKEAILSVEAERIYSKDQILTMYLNESPYGGRRNGVESAAQTYFGKSAKNLTLDEAALLAGIPQSPTLYNPYNTEGNEALLARWRTTLNYMADQGYVKREEAEAAKKVDVLAKLKPLNDQTAGAKAPHFIQMVKDELSDQLGAKIVGQGGLTVKTTLDLRVQNVLEKNMTKLFKGELAYLPTSLGFDNAAFTMIDNKTGQVLGVMGSRDYNYPDYGAVNAATSFIQPGSSVKPLVYAALMNRQDNPNGTFGAGSIISDAPIPQNIYRTDNGQSVANADGRFKGNLPIRKNLAESRNVPAIKAMALNGVEETWKIIRATGDRNYCTDGADQHAGLASAIGGCGAKQVEHANAFATLARGGIYKKESTVLEVQNAQKEKIYKWKDEGKRVLDEQTTYMVSDILTDSNARAGTMGYNPIGFYIPGVKTATKTGTSDIGGQSKDLWTMSYTPKATLSIWFGNHIPKAMLGGNSLSVGPTVRDITLEVYNNIFIPDGTYKAGDWFKQPAGLQRLCVNGGCDFYPSWYNKQQKTAETVKMTFDKFSKKLAVDCTPESSREQLDVLKNVDKVTGAVSYTAPDGYDARSYDDKHKCSDQKPFVSVVSQVNLSGDKHQISALIKNGTYNVNNVEITVGGKTYAATKGAAGSWNIVVGKLKGAQTVRVVATDNAFYSGEASQKLDFSGGTAAEVTQ